MAGAEAVAMSDRRALLTEREREIVSGEADDVTDSYRYQTVSRIRSRLQRLEKDLEALEEHGALADDFRSVVGTGFDDELEALQAAARQRWGEEWAIEQRHWADGTSDAHAYHIEPTDDADVYFRDRLFVGDDGEVYHDRIRLRREEVLEVVERDEPPEDIASELVYE